MVTTLQKRPWDEFANRRGDWGRDLALLLGRTRGGLTLRELGQETGMKPHAVSKAIMRLAERLSKRCPPATRQTARRAHAGAAGA